VKGIAPDFVHKKCVIPLISTRTSKVRESAVPSCVEDQEELRVILIDVGASDVVNCEGLTPVMPDQPDDAEENEDPDEPDRRPDKPPTHIR
jgi:hypothetical protein